MLLLAVASGNFPISSFDRTLGHSNRGSLVRIISVQDDLSVTFGADVGIECVLNSRIPLHPCQDP